MPGKKVDALKALKYKVARLEGENIKRSLLQAGYAPATAHLSSSNSIVKQCEPELAAMVKASDISVDWVIGKLNAELVGIDAKPSDRVRILELLGKYLNMFKDNNTVNVAFFDSSIVKDLPPIDVSSTTA